MPLTTLTFPNDINVSVQVGDIIYYAPADTVNMHDELAGSITEFGTVNSINGNNIEVLHFPIIDPPQPTDFIMFAKNRSVNMSSLLGYFAQFRISNNSTSKSEMYSLSVDVTESSK
jgi:hypothetical protein